MVSVYRQIFMMLSESSENQKSMWNKLPAALTWITAVHHCTRGDTFPPLNTKRDKELLRNTVHLSAVLNLLHEKLTHTSHIIFMFPHLDCANFAHCIFARSKCVSRFVTSDRDPRTCLAEQQAPPPRLLQEIFLERQRSVLHFTNVDCVGEWPDGRRQPPGFCKKKKKAVKDFRCVLQSL